MDGGEKRNAFFAFDFNFRRRRGFGGNSTESAGTGSGQCVERYEERWRCGCTRSSRRLRCCFASFLDFDGCGRVCRDGAPSRSPSSCSGISGGRRGCSTTPTVSSRGSTKLVLSPIEVCRVRHHLSNVVLIDCIRRRVESASSLGRMRLRQVRLSQRAVGVDEQSAEGVVSDFRTGQGRRCCVGIILDVGVGD